VVEKEETGIGVGKWEMASSYWNMEYGELQLSQ